MSDDSNNTILDDLGPREGGGRWRQVEIEVAQRRARDQQWQDIADAVGLKVGTIKAYTGRPWWDQAYEHFVAQRAEERRRQIEAEEKQRRDEWTERDARLAEQGVPLALRVLMEAAQGRRLRDEDAYQQSLAAGMDRRQADRLARQDGSVPTWNERIWAAKEILKGSGYTKGREEMARAAVEREERMQQRLDDEQQDARVDVAIAGVDYEPDEGADG